MSTIERGRSSGSTPSTFFNNTADAAPIWRTILSWSPCTSTCSFVASSSGKKALKFTIIAVSIMNYPSNRKISTIGVILILAEEEPSTEDTSCHIVNTRGRDCSVVHEVRKVLSPP